MRLPLTSESLPRVEWRDEAASTNAVLRELVGEDPALPQGTLVATANQTAGRGRQGREWVTPPGTALSVSLLLRPRGAGLGLSWLPLIAGSAVTAALQPLFRGDEGGDEGTAPSIASKRVGVKWPNDVHVRDEDDAVAGRPGRKLCGILCEALPSGEVIVGFGINLLQEEWRLPTDRAGSVRSEGGDTGGAESLDSEQGSALADRVLAAASTGMLSLVERSRTDPDAVRTRVLRDSLTIGTEVRVHLPNGEIVDGRAVGLDPDGCLVVDRPTTGRLIVSAADVEHLR